jgi:hypothetical protein
MGAVGLLEPATIEIAPGNHGERSEGKTIGMNGFGLSACVFKARRKGDEPQATRLGGDGQDPTWHALDVLPPHASQPKELI